MSKIADPLKERILRLIELGYDETEPMLVQTLTACADQIDRDHERRMEQCRRETRRRMARDMRWAVTMLEAKESRRHIRETAEEGESE